MRLLAKQWKIGGTFLALLALGAALVAVSYLRAQRGRLDQALAEAVDEHKIERIKTLLEQGADPNAKADFLYYFDPSGDMSATITRPRDDLSSRLNPFVRPEGTPVLAIAASQRGLERKEEVVQLLLAHGANPNMRDVNGQTPLMAAAWSGNAKIVRMLLEKGADPNARDNGGRTALNRANGPRLKDVAALLRKAGAKQ